MRAIYSIRCCHNNLASDPFIQGNTPCAARLDFVKRGHDTLRSTSIHGIQIGSWRQGRVDSRRKLRRVAVILHQPPRDYVSARLAQRADLCGRMRLDGGKADGPVQTLYGRDEAGRIDHVHPGPGEAQSVDGEVGLISDMGMEARFVLGHANDRTDEGYGRACGGRLVCVLGKALEGPEERVSDRCADHRSNQCGRHVEFCCRRRVTTGGFTRRAKSLLLALGTRQSGKETKKSWPPILCLQLVGWLMMLGRWWKELRPANRHDRNPGPMPVSLAGPLVRVPLGGYYRGQLVERGLSEGSARCLEWKHGYSLATTCATPPRAVWLLVCRGGVPIGRWCSGATEKSPQDPNLECRRRQCGCFAGAMSLDTHKRLTLMQRLHSIVGSNVAVISCIAILLSISRRWMDLSAGRILLLTLRSIRPPCWPSKEPACKSTEKEVI